ncbi:winged helix-turn-helix transcriptional regulator [Aeromicrobium sp. UC242_57]|uniref:winged helix-turn-helix transcriptional regulator n=1 Tax=Aeromicrobium sp. UC242_57 TaxID=3374624 RepID=UPI00379A772E
MDRLRVRNLLDRPHGADPRRPVDGPDHPRSLQRVRRFDALQDHLGVARDVLTKRLQLLVDEGLVDKQPIKLTGQRSRHEYVLTAAGRDLRTILVAIMDWGDQHRAGADGPPTQIRHRDCGASVHARLVCDDGHPITSATRTELVPLAGARIRQA